MKSLQKMIQAYEMAIEYIDALPKNIVLPTMPGFDRNKNRSRS